MELVYLQSARYISNYKIEVVFNNGKSGIIDFKDFLNEKIYEPLKNKEYFRNFNLNSWTIEWENGADFSPEFLIEILNKKTLNLELTD